MKKPFVLVALIALSACLGRPLRGAEPAAEFLNALRARGYYDTALEYLEMVKDSPLVPIDFKESLLYEKGVTLIEASRLQADESVREQYWNEAQQNLRQFAQQHASHAKANAARSQLGNLIVERARMKVEQSKQPNAPRDRLLAEAKALYDEAFKAFVDLQESVRTQLEWIPKVLDLENKQQAALAETRNHLRADYLQTLLLAAAIREETAETVKEGSEDFKQLLTDSADRYEEMYKTYRLRLAGRYARLYQGRANQKLGKLKDALGYYGELLDEPHDAEELRILKTKTLRLAMEAWLAQKQYVEAIRWGADWVRQSGPADDIDPDWLAIRMSLAKAYKMQADETDGSDQAGKRTIAQSLEEAREQAKFVAGKRSEFQEDARRMVAELGGPDRTGEKADPQNFAEAAKAGRQALDSLATAELVVNTVPQRIKTENDATEKANLEKQLDEAKQTLATARDEAMDYFRLAQKLADEETSLEEINTVRYFMCYLYYQEGDFYRAAVMGDFVSRRYPDSAGARPCAKIAMASYVQIYGESEPDERQFAADHIVEVAQYIAETWPDQPEAEEALNTLIPFMINAGELERAQEFLAKIPESSPKRAEAELQTGQAMWGAYLRQSQSLRNTEQEGNPDGIDLAAEQSKLAALKTTATKTLADGHGRLGGAVRPDAALATAMLSLAQAYVESQQADKAVEVLEHPRLGPLTLLNKKSPVVGDQALSEEIFKTALRGYIGTLDGDNGAGVMDKAKAVMEQLKATASGADGGAQRLLAIYVSLARDLEQQLASATPGAKLALSEGFETFLRQLSQDSSDLSVLNWVAESFGKLGAGLDDGPTLNEDAKRYYQASVDAYQNILDKAELDAQTKLQIQIRRAAVMGQMREFDQALNVFEQALTANPMMINVQVEAAKLLELWAKHSGQEGKYLDAITGFSNTGQNPPAVWGWGKIANKTSAYPQFADTFYEARLHIAQCRFDLAGTKNGDEQRQLLEAARRDIRLTKQLFPDLGGQKWTPQFDALLKRIQARQGEPTLGLKALDTPTASASGP